MNEPRPPQSHADAATTPVGITTICPQCGATLDAVTTSCGRCGAVISGGGADGERADRLRARLQGQIGAQYALGPLIGRGGMGIVFKARELALDREVALKVLAFDPVLNPEAYTRFEREARLAARLDHPNIVPIFSVGQGDGVAYYTMRFVRGGSLEALVEREGALPLEHAGRLLKDVASALDFAHAQGVVHRDIKPANILLSDSGHAMVADFGIARAFAGDSATTSSASQTGVVGSPAYMAPEQWRGERPDGRADQYALAVLAYELLSGQRPFREPSMQELLQKHLQEPPPSIDIVRKGLPAHVGMAIRRAMAKDPADRYPSADAFVKALVGEGAVGTVRAVRPAVTTPRPWVGYAAAAVLVLLAVPVARSVWRDRAASNAAPAAVPTAAAPAPTMDTLAERLARELEETRKIALDAQRRAERAEAEQKASLTSKAAAAPTVPAQGHVSVSVRGGTPKLFIDNKEVAPSTPALIAIAPGQHIVRVGAPGGQRFFPQQYVIDVSPGDTSQLQFADARFGQRELQGLPQRLQRGGNFPFDSTGRRGATLQGPAAPNAPGVGPGRAPSGGQGGMPPNALMFNPSSANPYYLDNRVWARMPQTEQEKITRNWARMTVEQRQRMLTDVRLRGDSLRAKYARPPQPQQPPQP